LIGTRRGVERVVQNTREELGLLPAVVETEDELVQVTLQVFRADAVKSPCQPGL
jgi:hypothetical protein